jgi:hypothetical protein
MVIDLNRIETINHCIRAVYPFLQSYVTAPEFERKEKVIAALKENLLFYLIIIVVVAIIAIYVIIASGFGL